MDRLYETFDALDRLLIDWMTRYGVRLLRVALGTVFLWFGGLKVIGRSPVADLVAATLPWLPASWFVPALGAWEVAVGLGLILAVFLRVVLLLFWLQMAGTFLVLIVQPGLAFQGGNPLLLTTLGEFVVKNVVLITAGIVVGSTVRTMRRNGQG